MVNFSVLAVLCVPSASDLSQMECSTNSRSENIASIASMFCMHHVVQNVASSSLEESSRYVSLGSMIPHFFLYPYLNGPFIGNATDMAS